MRTRKLSVQEARKLIVEEEAEQLIDAEEVNQEALSYQTLVHDANRTGLIASQQFGGLKFVIASSNGPLQVTTQTSLRKMSDSRYSAMLLVWLLCTTFFYWQQRRLLRKTRNTTIPDKPCRRYPASHPGQQNWHLRASSTHPDPKTRLEPIRQRGLSGHSSRPPYRH